MYSFFKLNISVTRAFRKKIHDSAISVHPKVKIERNLAFERFLLVGPQGTSNIVRHTAPAKKKASIPIGARGRKRSIVLLTIGLTPNLDNHIRQNPAPSTSLAKPAKPSKSLAKPATPSTPLAKSAIPPSTDRQIPSSNAVAPSSTNRQPAKRTYSRATSTPFPKSTAIHRPRGVSFPLLNDESSMSTLVADDTSLAFQFDETFGRLHYDTSDSE